MLWIRFPESQLTCQAIFPQFLKFWLNEDYWINKKWNIQAEAAFLKPEAYLEVPGTKYVEMIASIMIWASSAPASACAKVSGIRNSAYRLVQFQRSFRVSDWLSMCLARNDLSASLAKMNNPDSNGDEMLRLRGNKQYKFENVPILN
jgi:hypothetical protein